MKKTFGHLGRRIAVVAILTLSVVVALFALASPKPALAANPSTISFQGKVVDNNGLNVSNGSYTFVFRLYQNVTIGTYNPNSLACAADTNCWWEETDTVTVTSGTFQVALGGVCAFTSACNSGHGGIDFNTQNSLSLTMKFNGDAAGYMTPLVAMQSVPYALNSDKLGGLTSSGYIQNNSGAAQSSSSFHIDGTGIADVKLQSPSFDTATSNGTLGFGATNGGAITLGNVTNSTFLFNLKNASATALQVKNGSGNELLTIDTSANSVILGKKGSSGINGSLVFNTTNASNTTVTISAASTGTSYALTLPTTGPAVSQCLQTDASVATQLKFASCGGGGGTLASTYNSAATTGNTIALATAGGGIIVQDASSTVGNIFTLQKNGGTSNYFNVTSSAITIEDSGATHRTAVSIDITNHILKVFSPDGTTNYASVSATNTDATFKSAGTGTTIIGSGTGAITINAGAGSAVNITGHAASTWQVDNGGSLAIQGGSTLTLSSTTSSAISLDSGTTGAVNVGTGASAKTTTIGSTVTTSTTNIKSGSGNINLNPGAGNKVVYSQGAGSNLQLTASAATTTDQFAITNASGATSTTGVNGASVNFNTTGSTASADNAGMRIDVSSNNSGATTTLEGLKIGDLSSAEANSTETGLYVGTGWDVGLDLESGGIQLAAQSSPVAPAAGLIRLYAKSVAGRIVLKTIGSAGIDTPLQNALWQNNTVIWTPGVAGGTWQGASGGTIGTNAIQQPTTTNLYTSERRSTNVAATAAANIQNGIRSDAQFFRGNVAGNGGFFMVVHFGTETWTAGDRLFVGMGVCTTACTTANPSTLVNIAGFGIDAGDTAITFMHNDGSGTATKDTIAGQPTLASNQGYDAYIYMKPMDSTIYYRLDDTNAATTIIDTSTSTDIIAVNTLVVASAVMGTGTNTTAANSKIGINRIYIETDH